MTKTINEMKLKLNRTLLSGQTLCFEKPHRASFCFNNITVYRLFYHISTTINHLQNNCLHLKDQISVLGFASLCDINK